MRRPSSWSRSWRWGALAAGGVIAMLLLAACGGGTGQVAQPSPPPPARGAPTTAPPAESEAMGVGQPREREGCSARATDAATLLSGLAGASGGERICVFGDLGRTRLTITTSGAPGKPIVVLGGGQAAVAGITIEADNVIVDGFQVPRAPAPGIEIRGSNVTVENNTVTHPTGDDYDGLRFFGSNLTIAHNTIADISPDGSGAHADCMQTFATDDDHPASQNVTITGNRCERIANTCLIAEGPNSSAGDGSGTGTTTNFTFSHNYCDVHAAQALMIDDVQNITAAGNQVIGSIEKAFAFQNRSTGVTVQGNKIGPDVGYEVGIDDSSRPGYQGPASGGGP